MRRVLVIEDDAWQAEMTARQLARHDFQVEIAHDALAAFAMIDAHPPDAIILDMMLPGPNGMTFLHELRSHADIADIPVVVCSTQKLELKILQPYGVAAVIDKTTMEPDDVVVAVRKVLT